MTEDSEPVAIAAGESCRRGHRDVSRQSGGVKGIMASTQTGEIPAGLDEGTPVDELKEQSSLFKGSTSIVLGIGYV